MNDSNHAGALRLPEAIADQQDRLGEAWTKIEQGIALGRQSKLAEAIGCFQEAIRLKPDCAEANYNLGIALQMQGRLEEAMAHYQQALRLKSDYADAHNNLGNALAARGRLDEAVIHYRHALRIRPGFADAHSNLGNAYREQGQLTESVAECQEAVRLEPDHAAAHINLGIALQAQGRIVADATENQDAIAHYHEALRLNPECAEAHSRLGIALHAQGRVPEAIDRYRQALRVKPGLIEARLNLGIALQTQNQLEEAVAQYQETLRLQPDNAEAHYRLGTALRAQAQLGEALAHFQQAVRPKPDHADAFNDMGNVLKDQGRLDEALTAYRAAMKITPDDPSPAGNLVYTLNFCPGVSAQTIYDEARQWSQHYAEPLAKFIQPHTNGRAPDRRLRIGYISPDFRSHPIGRFMLPLLQCHDHERFEIFNYSSLNHPDAITDRCRAAVDVWRNVFGSSDEKVAELIRQDRIDILIDLTMHMANNRLLVFARKPAPVQATYLAYPGTTGLSTMDYRLTDPYLDPPASPPAAEGEDWVRGSEYPYSEESIHLPETYWCYQPEFQTPPATSLPALHAGHITFGCLNNFCKATPPTLETWRRLLQTVPESRLLLHAQFGSHRDRVRDFFAEQNVAPERLTFVALVPPAEYLQHYERIDVALDPFPYGGGTTTCDALWMGVPVVSLAGQTAVGRGGLSILSNIGLRELVARDTDQYITIAAELACKLPRLSELRATLRERMRNSPLMDAPRFARNVEAAYRTMWKRWSENVTTSRDL